MAKLKVRKANNTQANLRSTSRNPFAEAESWRQHFQLIQMENIPHTHTIADWMSQTPTPQEFKRALQKMKVGKAPGDDGVTVEMLKWTPPSIIDKVITITQHIWQTTTRADPQELVDHWPAEWLTATVIPLWKMKHPKTCKHNWRGVTLLSIRSKLIARIVANRVQTFSESFMDEQQQGFRRNRGVDDVLQESRRLTEEIVSSRGPQNVHITLYDIEKAYPRINRDALWQLLQRNTARIYQRV